MKYSTMDKSALLAHCDSKGYEVPPKATKTQLIALIKGHEGKEDDAVQKLAEQKQAKWSLEFAQKHSVGDVVTDGVTGVVEVQQQLNENRESFSDKVQKVFMSFTNELPEVVLTLQNDKGLCINAAHAWTDVLRQAIADGSIDKGLCEERERANATQGVKQGELMPKGSVLTTWQVYGNGLTEGLMTEPEETFKDYKKKVAAAKKARRLANAKDDTKDRIIATDATLETLKQLTENVRSMKNVDELEALHKVLQHAAVRAAKAAQKDDTSECWDMLQLIEPAALAA